MRERYIHDQKAGNFHDVWKHFILAEYLRLCSKNGVMTYIDTHSGSMAYKNQCPEQLNTGILKFPNKLLDIPPSTYSQVLDFYGAEIGEENNQSYLLYPGSLAVAAYCFLNIKGKIIGCDISEVISNRSLKSMKLFKKYSKTQLEFSSVNMNGYDFAKSYIENNKETGIVFVDPPYYPNEKNDWDQCIDLLSYIIGKSTWSYVLWYCIYTNSISSHLGYYRHFKDIIFEYKVNAVDIQLQISPLTSTYNKSITGMLIVNPHVKSSELINQLNNSGMGILGNMLGNQEMAPKIKLEIVGDLS